MSYSQLKELRKVLDYPKLKFTKKQKEKFLGIILEETTLVETSNKLDVIKEDPNDNMILESAVENNVDYLVSGDDHLLKIKNFKNVKILTASEFLELFDSK